MSERKNEFIVGSEPGSVYVEFLNGTGGLYSPAALALAAEEQAPRPAAASNLVKVDVASADDIIRHYAAGPIADLERTVEAGAKAELSLGEKAVPRRGRPKSAVLKRAVSLRLDVDVIEGFRAGGAGWQPRMNAVLRAHLRAGPQGGDERAVNEKSHKTP